VTTISSSPTLCEAERDHLELAPTQSILGMTRAARTTTAPITRLSIVA
jgi:hypothetical protein